MTSTIIARIISGEFDAELSEMLDAIRLRSKALGEANLFLKPGTKVRLKNLSPKYLNGMVGTVMRRKSGSKRVVIELESPVGRFGKTISPPAQCIEVVE